MSFIGLQPTTVQINNINDLPKPVNGVIRLKSYKYNFNQTVNIGSNILYADNKNVTISANKALNTIVYTGSDCMISGSNSDFLITNITLYTPTGCVFDLKATDPNKIFVANLVIYYGNNSIGVIDGYENVANNFVNYKFNSGPINIKNTNHVVYSQNYYDYTNTPPFIQINTGSFNSVEIHDCRFETTSGDLFIPIEYDYQNTDVTIGALKNNIFNAPSGSFVDIDLTNSPQWIITGNIGIQNYQKVPIIGDSEMASLVNVQNQGLIAFNEDIEKFVGFKGLQWKSFDTTFIFQNLFTEDFESGSFITNSWTVANNGTNDWYVGTAEKYEGSYGAYVSNDGGTTATYTINNTEVSHFYKDFAIPVGTTELQLTFWWKCEGELNYDFGAIYKTTTAVTPVAGTEVNSSFKIGEIQYNNNNSWSEEAIPLGNEDAGTTIRLIFSWRNDSSVGTQPPMCIDLITLNYI